MTTELMLELAAHVHERCKDVPHDIGITLGEIVIRHQNEETEKIRAAIPEGYLIAKDTLAESVALMAVGLRACFKERYELMDKIDKLENFNTTHFRQE